MSIKITDDQRLFCVLPLQIKSAKRASGIIDRYIRLNFMSYSGTIFNSMFINSLDFPVKYGNLSDTLYQRVFTSIPECEKDPLLRVTIGLSHC